MTPGAIGRDELLGRLPPPWPHPLLAGIRSRIASSEDRFVVLDDDPTGGQTLHGLPVLTAWSIESLLQEVERSPAFFLVTNSRALSEADAVAMAERTGRELRDAEQRSGRRLIIGSRGDSTLRGHFPAETTALYRAVMGDGRARPTCIFVPYFGEGGRFTVNDTQYVLQDTELVPVAETEFARDPAFAYAHSHLPSWLEAAALRRGETSHVVSISIDELRLGGPVAAAERLRGAPEGSTIVVNAACDRDLEVLVAGLLDAEAEGRRFLYRTAASFVRVRAGIDSRPPLTAEELSGLPGGGLIIVGSYVERTSRQLQVLMAQQHLPCVELRVEALFDAGREAEVARAAAEVDAGLRAGRDVVLYTSRSLLRDRDGLDSHGIGRAISSALCDVLALVQTRPGFLLVKGGSTAHQVAVSALGARRAVVLGQLLPGVPVWRLGDDSKYRGLPYVIFPGNVGGPDALSRALDVLHGGAHAGAR